MKSKIIKIIIALIIFIIALLLPIPNEKITLLLYGISYLIVGFEVIKEALENILKGKVFDENFLMTIATLGAFAIHEYPEAVTVMLFYQLGEFFADYAVEKSKKSITELMNIRPDYANVIRNEETLKVNPSEVKINEMIIVKPGEKIPLDGIIKKGTSMIDMSALTRRIRTKRS